MVKTTEKVLFGILVLAFIGMSSFFITALPTEDVSTSSNVNFPVITNNQISPEQAKISAISEVPGVIQDWEVGNENGNLVYEIDILKDGAIIEVKVDVKTGEVLMAEEEKKDVSITGNSLERASQVALTYIGEGRVTDSEIGDEEGYYEIEVTLDNGDEADVHLDENFNVLSVEYD